MQSGPSSGALLSGALGSGPSSASLWHLCFCEAQVAPIEPRSLSCWTVALVSSHARTACEVQDRSHQLKSLLWLGDSGKVSVSGS